MRIALLLGSFNPVHRGHVAVARWALNSFDRVWVVPTPQNPIKDNTELASWDDRLSMLALAFQGINRIEICTVENELESPHYTIHTIEHLQQQYPDDTFSILCGSDISDQLTHWHRSEQLQQIINFTIYPRSVESSELPIYQESSSAIRKGDQLQGLDPKVLDYIELRGLYFASALKEAQKAWAEADFGRVINIAANHPEVAQLDKMAQMAREILDFRCTDIYNP